jgi:hypothetical protein
MRRLNSVKSPAILIAAMLAFIGGASAAPIDIDIGSVTICDCRGGCRLITTCLGKYCIRETRCGDCEFKANCRTIEQSQLNKSGEKVCLYRRGDACVTRVKGFARR